MKSRDILFENEQKGKILNEKHSQELVGRKTMQAKTTKQNLWEGPWNDRAETG